MHRINFMVAPPPGFTGMLEFTIAQASDPRRVMYKGVTHYVDGNLRQRWPLDRGFDAYVNNNEEYGKTYCMPVPGNQWRDVWPDEDVIDGHKRHWRWKDGRPLRGAAFYAKMFSIGANSFNYSQVEYLFEG